MATGPVGKQQAALTHTVCETIFFLWEKDFDWPNADSVLIKLEKQGHRFQNFEALQEALQPGTVRKLDLSWNDKRAYLTPLGVSLCARGSILIKPFIAILRHAYKVFKKEPFGATTVKKARLRAFLSSADECLVTRVSQLLFQDMIWIHRSNGLATAEWEIRPGLGIVHYSDVRVFDDFIRSEQRRNRQPTLGKDHVALLQRSLASWQKDHHWPNFLRFLLDSKNPGKVLRLLEELPKDYWQDSVLYENEPKDALIRLWLEGIIASNTAAPELSLIHRLVTLCCTHVLDHEREQRLTAEEAAGKLHADPDLVKHVGLLLEHRDYDLGMNVYREGSSWVSTPTREILRYKDSKDFKELWSRRPKPVKAGRPMRVFYSWQSDLPGKTNRNFIEDALKRAIKKVNKDGEVQLEAAPDRDTKGVPGSPSIVDTIFTKIRECAVFVCDVSIINGEQGRPTPNPNVLFEAGYALAHKGWDKVICVVNTAFGHAESLPFDLRSRRVMPYKLTESSEGKADERQRFVNTLADAIALAIRAKP